MKSEAAFKKHFKASVKAHGGFSISLAAPMINGMPDLWVAMPGYIPILLEAKWVGSSNKSTFRRKIEYRPLQEHIIKQCHKVTNYSAMTLININWHDVEYAVLIPCDNSHFESITQRFSLDCPCVIAQNKIFDVPKLFAQSQIPQLAYTLEPLLTNSWKPDSVEVSANAETRIIGD